MPNGTQPVRIACSDFENSGFFRHWSFVIRILSQLLFLRAVAKFKREHGSMLRAQENRLLIRAFDLDAVGFD